MLVIKPTKIRGNHYHNEFVEYFLVVQGFGVMVSRDENGKEIVFHLSKGQCLKIQKKIPHAFYAIEHTTAMAFLTKNWDKCNPPIVHEDLIQNYEEK